MTPADSLPSAIKLQPGAFAIELAWSERTLIVQPNESALQVLIAAGVPIEPGCQTGACGECVTRYLEGDLIHKDSCLNASDRETAFCPCVSRAQTRIVIAY